MVVARPVERRRRRSRPAPRSPARWCDCNRGTGIGPRAPRCRRRRDSARRRHPTVTPPAARACRSVLPHRGSRSSSRAVVVCRPRWSPARTSPVACTSVPTSAFTSVDFPTPDAPMSAIVRLSEARARMSSTPTPDTELVRTTSTPGAESLAELDRRVDVRLIGFVGFRERDNRVRSALVRQHEFAFEPAQRSGRWRATARRARRRRSPPRLAGRAPRPPSGRLATNADRRGNTATIRSSR